MLRKNKAENKVTMPEDFTSGIVPFTLPKAFASFFRVGLFTIGGGPVMIPFIEQEMVDKKHWLSKEEFMDLMVMSQSLPGIFAANFAIAIGYKLKGLKGSIVCCVGNVLPSLVIILLIALFFQQFRGNRVVENVFLGIRPAVTALILGPIFKLSKAAAITWRTVWMPIVAALLIWQLGVSPIWIIVAGIAGGLARYLTQQKGGKA